MAVSEVAVRQPKEALSVTRVSRGLDRIEVTFDDPNLVANAGLLLGGHAGVAARARGVGQRHGASGRAGSAGARPGRKVLTLVHAIVAGGIAHRPRRRAALRAAPQAVLRAPGDGALDVGHVPAGLHVRSCPPARGRHRRDAAAGVGAGRRSRRRPSGDRHRLDDLRGDRQAKQGAAFGYTKVLGLSPDPGHPGRHRRGAARPDAQRLGQHPARARRFIDELDRPGPPRRRRPARS